MMDRARSKRFGRRRRDAISRLDGDQRAVATIKDVARQAGLSVTTASRALNNYGDVAEATRARVQEVARDLDYHPNAVARSLQRSRANTVGLIIPPILHRSHNAFWLEFIGGMAATCALSGVDVLVSTADAQNELGQSLQRMVRGRRVDGLLVCDIRRVDPRIPSLQQGSLPFVAFGRTTGELDYPYIDVDGAAGVTQAMEHLIQLGHRRIAYLGLDPDFGFSHFRFAGYGGALDGARLPVDSSLVFHGLTEEAVPGVMAALLAREDRPTAIFAAADFLALAALKAARALGLRLPADLSLVSFDDSLLLEHAEPPLTAISQSNRRLGEEAAALLLARVARPALPLVQRLIVPTLVVRRSTATPSS
jgi:DNA-binding LacI/PurR family transcriptional regulator